MVQIAKRRYRIASESVKSVKRLSIYQYCPWEGSSLRCDVKTLCRHRLFPYALILSLVILGTGLASPVFAAPEYRAVITYRVQSGDTLWSISNRLDVSAAQIQRDNPGIGTLTPGQVLYITTRVVNNAFPYRVQSGDTLYRISRRLGRSIGAIQGASNLHDATLRIGQMLRIPAADSHEVPAWVQPGDTLSTIAQRYGVSIFSIRSINPLTGDHLRVNQILRIPGSRQATAPATTESGVTAYRVQPGDVLSGIASRFGTTTGAIWATNHLSSDVLMPGQLLYIPPGRSGVSVTGPQGTQVPGHGELLDWTWARWYYPPGTVATVVDLYTGREFSIRRLGGSNHADSEPLTSQDTAIMRDIYGGQWSWNTRPILLKVRGRIFAASMAGMPHDVQTIGNNNFQGHFCLYFHNARSHRTNSIQPAHQANVLIAAGRQ